MSQSLARSTRSTRLPIWKRAALVLVGCLVALTGVGLALVFVGLFVQLVREGRRTGYELLQAALAILAAASIFGAFSVMGARRVVAGLRGRAMEVQATSLQASWTRHHWYLLGLVAWTVLAIGAGSGSNGPLDYLVSSKHVPGRWPWYVMLGYLLLPVQVALHELGHAAGGALVGLRFVSLRVGWLLVSREDQRLMVRWAPPSLPDILGMHVGIPREVNSARWRRAVHAAAGPAASLSASWACYAAADLLGAPASVGQALTLHLLWVGCWSGGALGVVNLLPFRTRSGLASDGANILWSLRPETPPMRAVRLFHENWAMGRRPREWGVDEAVFLSAAEQGPAVRESLFLAALSILLDRGERERAVATLRQALETPESREPSMRLELQLQAVMLDAFEGRPEEASRRLEKLEIRPELGGYSRLAQAVVAAASGRATEAARGLEAWERALKEMGQADSIRVGNQWAVEELRARLAAASEAVVTHLS